MSNHRYDDDGAPLGEAAAALRALLETQALSVDARARHLYALRERAAVLGPGLGAGRRRIWAQGLAHRVAAAVSAGGLVVTLGSGVAVAASADTLPGDRLYEVKQLTERVRLALPETVAGEVDIRLRLAVRRLDEAAELRQRGGPDADVRVAQAILAYEELMTDAAALAGEDEALERRVRLATAVAQDRLEALLDAGLPPQASERARQALEAAHERIDGRPPAAGPPAEEPGGSDARPGSGDPGPPPAPGPDQDPAATPAPGRPDDPGPPPEAPGPPTAPERPGHSGRPEGAGPPGLPTDGGSPPAEDPGPPGGGPSANRGRPDHTGPPGGPGHEEAGGGEADDPQPTARPTTHEQPVGVQPSEHPSAHAHRPDDSGRHGDGKGMPHADAQDRQPPGAPQPQPADRAAPGGR